MIDEQPRNYKLKVTKSLLVQGHAMGVKPDDMLEFFAVQIQSMLTRKPNCIKDIRIWVIRGFYPGTPLFFKLSLADKRDEGLYAKAQMLSFKGKYGNEFGIMFDGNYINEIITNKMENIFLGANHTIDPLIKSVKMPRCMSPKGMKIFRYKKPTKRGKNEANKK